MCVVLPFSFTSLINLAKSHYYIQKTSKEADIKANNYSLQQLPHDINYIAQFDTKDNDQQLLKSPFRNHGIGISSIDVHNNAESSPKKLGISPE